MEKALKPGNAPFDDLIRLIGRLRGENGCPWDRKQTPQSLSVYLIEEVYELVEAIRSKTPEAVKEELGDVLFLLFFIAAQYHESGHFDINDVARQNAAKMINRHPHVFGDTAVRTPEDVRQNWSQIKAAENRDAANRSILDSVPEMLPALMRAYRISERAARTGFDWDDLDGVVAKAEEEWHELKAELGKDADKRDNPDAALEFGDVLFTLTNVARFAGIHPETALSAATNKFQKRFTRMERIANEADKKFENLSFDEMQTLWDEVKGELKNG